MLFLLCLIKLKLLYSFLTIISAPDYNSHSFLSRLLFFYWLYSVPTDRIYLAMWLEPWYSVSAKNWSAFSMPNLKKWSSDPQCWLLLLLIYHFPTLPYFTLKSLSISLVLSCSPPRGRFSLLPMRVPSSGDADVSLTRASVCHLTSQAQCLPGALQIRLGI